MAEESRGRGRPALPESEQRTRIYPRVHPSVIARLESLAARWGCSQSRAVERCIEQAADAEGVGDE